MSKPQHVRISFVNRAVSAVKGAPGQVAGMGIVLDDGAHLWLGLSRTAWGQVLLSPKPL